MSNHMHATASKLRKQTLDICINQACMIEFAIITISCDQYMILNYTRLHTLILYDPGTYITT